MPPQGAAYNVDWILSNTSNVHVANDRAWFTTYTPYRTKISGMPGGGPSIDVHGIGTVVLGTWEQQGDWPDCLLEVAQVVVEGSIEDPEQFGS